MGSRLEAKVDFSKIKRGDCSYGLYAVIDPAEANKGYSLQFWWWALAMGKIAGWKYYVSRISSPVSHEMLKRLGAETLAEIEHEGEKMWMDRIDFSKPWPSYSMLQQMRNANKKVHKAKL